MRPLSTHEYRHQLYLSRFGKSDNQSASQSHQLQGQQGAEAPTARRDRREQHVALGLPACALVRAGPVDMGENPEN